MRHLFCKYKTPLFLDEAWIKEGEKKYIDWFIHIGLGKSAKDLKDLPIEFTKKMAHIFINTPDYYSISPAIRRAQVLSYGGDERLAYEINGSILGNLNHNKETEKFWSTIIEFLAKTPMLNMDLVGPIIDYIQNQKFLYQRGYVQPNVWGSIAPPQPGFSIKGRSIDKLIQDTEAWHEGINKIKKSGYSEWKSTGIKPFELIEGKEGEKSYKVYTITEILNSKDLSQEGSAMKHCVSSYTNSCYRGVCSIWSLKLNGTERLVTIEVRKDSGIAQVRGKRNVRATEKEKSLVTRWALENDLKTSSFAF